MTALEEYNSRIRAKDNRDINARVRERLEANEVILAAMLEDRERRLAKRLGMTLEQLQDNNLTFSE